MSVCRAGFTLLEICLALSIGIMLILLTVPSVSGLLAEQRLKRSFERFDRLVAAAANRSVTEHRTYALVWGQHEVKLAPQERKEGVPADASPDSLPMEADEEFAIVFPAAIGKRPAIRWLFWGNGTCEPATIDYHGQAGSWIVNYNPLTARGEFLSSRVQ